VALLLAVVISVGGLLDKVDPADVATWTLATLAVVAFSVMRDRSERKRLRDSVNALERSSTADALFTYATDDLEVITQAHNCLDLLQETGNLVFERGKNHLVSLLKSGVSVRVVLTGESNIVAGLMALRNWDLDPDGIRTRWRGRDAQLASLCASAGVAVRNLEIRYLPYPVGATFAIADTRPHVAKGIALVRESGFRVTFDEKPDFIVKASTAPTAFTLYMRQFESAYLSSSKLVLLEGAPRSGKTTTLSAVIGRVGSDHPRLEWVLSEQVTGPDGSRVGFSVRTKDRADGTVFATRQADGSYESIDNIWDELADQLTDALDDGKVVVVDEVGPIQLRSPRFRALAERLRLDKNAFVIASVSKAQVSGVAPLQESPRSTIVSLEKTSAATAEEALIDEVVEALRTSQFLMG
jgi:nucleoside-triphosphatase